MLSDYFSEINDHGTVVPVKDLAAFPRSEQEVLGASNFCDTSNAINATNLVSAVSEDGIVTFKDEATAKWSNSYIGKAHIENGITYYIMTNTKNPLVYGRIAINKSATQDPSQSDTANITVLDGGTKLSLLTPTVGVASFVANETADVYFWYCNDREMSTKHAVFSAGFMVALSADTSYAPYAMTNKELTENVTPIHTEATASTGTGSGDVSLNEANYKSIVKVGKVVFFNVRFTLNTATGTEDTRLVNLRYAPDALYPLISLRKRQAPYEEVCGLYINLSGEVSSYGIALPADDYWITGTYICK